MKEYDKLKELLYHILDNLYRWAMSQNLPLGAFNCVGETSQVNEDFVKSYNENYELGYFLKVDFKYHEKLHDPENYLPLLPRKKN